MIQEICIVGLFVYMISSSLIFINDFKNQIFTENQGWDYVSATNAIAQCSDGSNQVSIYGALNFGQKALIYKNFDLPPHYQVTLTFKLWIVDFVRSYNYHIYLDDQMIGNVAGSSLSYSQDYCGNLDFDGFKQVTFAANHINSKATIIITSNLDQSATITSWGIRDFVLSFNPCPFQCIQCQDATSFCQIWQFEIQFWVNTQITSSEGWKQNIGSFQGFSCLGQQFVQIYQLGDQIFNTVTIKPYYQVRIQFQLLKVGQFQNEEIQFLINSVIKYQQVFNNEIYYAFCNPLDQDGDMIINLSIDSLYSEFNSNQLTLQFQSNILSSNTYYGIRDFYVFIAPCMQNCIICMSNIDCQQCETDYTFDGTKCFSTIISPLSIYQYYFTQENISIQGNQSLLSPPDSSFSSNIITTCGAYAIFGGFQQPDAYFNLTTLFHNQVILRFTVIAIDDWDLNNILQVNIESTTYNLISRNKYYSMNIGNQCGSQVWNDNLYYFSFILNHYSPNLILSFKLSNPSIRQYYGVFNISLDYYYCGPKFQCSICDPSGTQCLACSYPTRQISNNCLCPQGGNIQSQICQDCNQKGPPTQVYCTALNLCLKARDNYIPYCLNDCDSGFSMNQILNQCEKNSPSRLDQFPVIVFGQYLNTKTFTNLPNWIYVTDVLNNPVSFPIGSCGQQNLIGGVGFQGNIFMNLYNLPPYRRIRIKYIMMLIDIQEDAIISTYLNGYGYAGSYYNFIQTSQNICGDPRNDLLAPYEILIYTTGQFQYQIQIQSFNATFLYSSFGIYDITISYQPCTDEIRCATCDDNGCLTCSVPARIQSPLCLCPTYEYMSYADCPTCPYKCQGNQCNLQGCIVCADSRRGGPPDCLCPTYEIYGVSSCPLCQQYCLHCSDSMCLECQSGYYPFGEYCYQCPYQCSTCLFNGCLTCSDPNRGPAPFCRCPNYEIIGQKQCPVCQQNCQTCDQSGCLICQTPRLQPLCDCPSNYYEKDNQCIQCDQECLTCNQYSCLSCRRSDQILPYCRCPHGYENANDRCTQDAEIIKSYCYFNQQLTQIIIGFNQQFFPIGLDNSNVLIQENCIILKYSNGLCQIFDQTIIYQFDNSVILNLGDEIIVDSDFIGFLNFKQFTINQIFVALNTNIDYRPYFDVSYPNPILTCKQYLITVNNIINVGNQNYQLEVTANGVQIQQQQNQIFITALIEGQIIINIKITNFVGYSLTQSFGIQSNKDLQLDFEILPHLGQLTRHFNMNIQISQIVLHSCNQNFVNTSISKIIDINFSNIYKTQFITQDQQIKLNIDVGSLSIDQIYQLNVTVAYQQYTKTQITNYTINQIKPFFSILGGNRMVYANNRLNVSAVIVDPDTQGLICFWSCLTLADNQDCGFNFTFQIYQIIETYQLALYTSYLFRYNCLGIVVQAIYHVVDIDEDQLFMFFPAFYSTYDLNKLYPVEYIIFNETKNNLLKPIILNNIKINVIQNFTVLHQELQINGYGFQNLLNDDGSLIIQAQINSMVASINVNLKNVNLTLELNVTPMSGVCSVTEFTLKYTNITGINSPFLFRYMAIINDKNIIQLSDWSVYMTQSFYLPQGVESKNYTYQIIGQIIDKFGYLFNISGAVQVFPSQNISSIYQLIEDFQVSDQYYQKLQYLGSQYLQIQQDGCEKGCSGYGLCKNQQCLCKDGYYLLDCSANQTQQNSLNQQIQKLLSDLMSDNMVNNTFLSLLLTLLNNYYIQIQTDQDYLISLIEYVIYNMEALINQEKILENNIDSFIKILNNPQNQLIQLQLDQVLANFIELVDILLDILLSGRQQIKNSTISNNLSLKLISIAKLYSYYQGSQLYIDENPYKLNLNNFQILAQRVSSNYSQIFFNQPTLMLNQISFIKDQKILQLQNDSIISQVIFKTNPYIFDENYPYQTQQNQLGSVQVYDQNGSQYRSFQPLTIQLVVGNKTQGSDRVCVAQQNGKWIAKLCQTIKITGSNVTSCQCDTLDQQSVVDDVNNLYGNSKIYALQNYQSILEFQYFTSILAYLLTFLGICSMAFGYQGYQLDVLEYQQNQQQIKKQNLQQQIEHQLELNYLNTEEEAILIRFDLMRAKHRDLKKEIIFGFKQLHPFIRIYSSFYIEEPRPARYIIYFLKQCILLSITSIFGKGFSVVQNVFLGIVSMIFITPLEKLLMQGFNQRISNKIKIILTSFLVIVYLGCWYICIAVSVTVDQYESNLWSLIFLTSFIINSFIVEGFTIVMKIMIAPYLNTILFNGGFLARFIYLYLYDKQASRIVKDLNMLNTIQF